MLVHGDGDAPRTHNAPRQIPMQDPGGEAVLYSRKATARATSLAEARIAADEKARKLREAADRLAAPKSD